MIRRSIALLMVVLAGCAQPTTALRATSGPTPRPGSTPPALASPAAPPLAAVDFSCRLPVLHGVTSGAPVSMRAGFVRFPRALMTDDAEGTITSLEPPPYDLDRPAFYDAAVGRWLPVGPLQSSPDGLQYARLTGGLDTGTPAVVHVVDVRSGSERTATLDGVPTGYPAPNSIADFDGRTAYVSWVGGIGSIVPGFGIGLWAADTVSGHTRQLMSGGWVEAVRSGSVWVGDAEQAVYEATTYHAIRRVDLATGARQRWFYQPDADVWLLGFDGHGDPVVAMRPASAAGALGRVEVRVVSQPGSEGVTITSDGE